MDKKNLSILCVLAISLYVVSSVFSATIVLKSGKTVQGTIIENTGESIKVDFNGVPLTYYREEIVSIDGTGFAMSPLKKGDREALSSSKQTVSPTIAQSSRKWVNWYAGASSYMGTMQTISIKGNAVFMQLRQDFEAANAKKDVTQLSQIIKKMKDQMAAIIAEVSALQVPEELKKYHAKQLVVFQQINMATDKFMTNDTTALISMMRTVTVSMVEACQELKRVYIQQEAPGNFIDPVDMVIFQLNAVLEKLDVGLEKFSNKTKQPQPTK
ncbi:MAG: hypothetical protein WCI77_01260 [Candidatus Omnitrophota bacterium]